MKYIKRIPKIGFVLLALIAITATSCKKKQGCTNPEAVNFDAEAKKDNGLCVNITEVRKATLIEFTAVWCGPCGSWGTEAFRNAIEANKPNVVPIASHAYSGAPDGMTNVYTTGFKNNFSISQWPNFQVGNYYKATSTNFTTEMNAILAEDIIANGALVFTINGGMISIKSKVNFFREGTGNYYLAVYIMEDDIDGSQGAPAGFDQNGDNSSTYTHDHVLRSGAVDDVFGEGFASGTISAGSKFSKEYSVGVNSEWVEANLYVIGVIWKKVGNEYQYVNAFEGVQEAVTED